MSPGWPARIAAGLVPLLLVLAAGAEGADGESLYRVKCALCHGPKGTPPEGMRSQGVPAFSDAAWQKGRTEADLRAAIEKGRPGTLMVGFRDKLTGDEIAAILKHVRSLAQPPRRP